MPNREASLRPFWGHPNARGWTVIGADGQKVGEVRDLLEDMDGTTRFLELELDQTTLEQDLTGARQHPAEPTGAGPLADDRQGDSGPLENTRVLIPWEDAHLKEKDEQVVLTTLRGSDLAALPVYVTA